MARRIVKGGNKTLRREITSEEVEKFQRSVKDYWVWKRSEIIRLAAEGYNNLEIEEITGIDEKNVRLWINRFNAEGFAGLFRKRGGKRGGKLSEEQIEELKQALKRAPSEFGYDHVAWTAKLVWQFIQDAFGVTYAYRYIYRLIKKIGFKLAKPYVTHIKQDEREVKKFEKQVLPAALKKKQKFEARGLKVLVLSQDEKHIWVDYPSFRIVCPEDEKPRIKANWNPHIRTSILGSIDNEGKLVSIEEDTANAETYCKFMDKIVESYPEYQVFMIFVDRASYHRAKLVREHIYELRRQGKNFKFIWLPRYSPEMSPIEQLWKPFGRNVHSKIINAKSRLVSVVTHELNVMSQSAKGLLAKYFPIMFG